MHEDAQILFEDAKKFAESGEWERAVEALKCFTEKTTDFSLCQKAAKLAGKILKTYPPEKLRPLKVALLSSSTTLFLEPLLPLYGLVRGLDLRVKSGDFGTWRQDILDPSSWLYSFEPDVVIIATHYRDAALPSFSQDPQGDAEKIAEQFVQFWEHLKKHSRAAILQHGFDRPNDDAAAYLSATHPGARARVLESANAALVRRAAELSVVPVDIAELRARCGADQWEDARLWHHAKQHPAPAGLPLLAREYVRAICAKLGLSKKVCVCDLDNTLWGGVIGEDGIDGITLGTPNAAGEAFAAFQTYLKELKQRGILLAVCSKNNEADALLPFEKHPAMVLKKDDFVSFKANWSPKSENIAQIAAELNLGLDSFVFVDDNRAEIEQVRAALPQVACVQLPQDSAEYVAALSRAQLFDTATLSADDLSRSQSYHANAARAQAQSGATDLKDFLQSLQMRCAAAPIGEGNLARAAQLLGKTNQFNLTTRRHSAEAILKMAAEKNAFARSFQLADKFGDNGIVGVLIALPKEDGVLEIDSFVMSCRVIGRGLENFMMAELIAFAREHNFKHLRGVYIPTAKNAQTADFYERLGFTPKEKSSDQSSFALDLEHAKIPETFIEKI